MCIFLHTYIEDVCTEVSTLISSLSLDYTLAGARVYFDLKVGD